MRATGARAQMDFSSLISFISTAPVQSLRLTGKTILFIHQCRDLMPLYSMRYLSHCLAPQACEIPKGLCCEPNGP